VIEATIAAMERLGAGRSRIVAALGPTIRQPNYEVGPEFVERFVAADSAMHAFSRRRSGWTRHVRPHRLYRRTGSRRGIAQFEDLGLCTFAEPERFFSYRRTTQRGEPDYGRHVNAIALTD
jgi:copper oxidase (laccase) domain-containing protein